MLLFRLEMKARPEKRKELLQTLLAWMDFIRKISGCLACRFYQNLESVDGFILTEDWRRPSDFEQHLQSENFRVLRGAMRLLCEPRETAFSVSSSSARTEVLEDTLRITLKQDPA